MYEKYFIAILDFWYVETFWIGEESLILIGTPETGKTTVLINIVEALEARSLYIGGTMSLRLAMAA